MSHLVGNPEDRFSHNEAQLMKRQGGTLGNINGSYSEIKFPFKRKACQVYEGGCCRQVSTVVSLVVW